MRQDSTINNDLKADEHVTFVYPRDMIILVSVLMMSIVVMVLVATVSARPFWLRTFMVLSIVWFTAMCLKHLLRLNERIGIAKQAISLNSPRASISIPWEDIARVTKRTSLLERGQLVIESKDGKRITAGEQLIGFYELCEIVNQRGDWIRRGELSQFLTRGVSSDRTGSAEQSGPVGSPSQPAVVGLPKCAECGSAELMPLNGWLAGFFVACGVCGKVRRKDTPANLSSWIRLVSRAWLDLSTLMWTLTLATSGALGFMLFVSVVYVVVWAVWNFILAPLAGTGGFSILDPHYLSWVGFPTFIVSIFLLMALRYFPKGFLSSLFHRSSLRKKNTGGQE